MVFGTLVGVFSVMWSELLMTSAISCPLWSESGVCVHISGEDWVWYVRDVLYAVLYVRVSCFVVRGCGVSRRYIDVYYCDMFSVVNVYLDHLKFCVVCINSRRYVCCSECDVVSNECNEPTSCLVQPIGAHCCEIMYFWCFGFRGELGFLNCDDVCMCVVNKQFELLEFVPGANQLGHLLQSVRFDLMKEAILCKDIHELPLPSEECLTTDTLSDITSCELNITDSTPPSPNTSTSSPERGYSSC